jgi:hypothetical protein
MSTFIYEKSHKTLFYIKRSSLVDHSKTRKVCWVLNGLVLGCPVPAETDHLNTKLVRYLDGHYVRKSNQIWMSTFQMVTVVFYLKVCLPGLTLIQASKDRVHLD